MWLLFLQVDCCQDKGKLWWNMWMIGASAQMRYLGWGLAYTCMMWHPVWWEQTLGKLDKSVHGVSIPVGPQ